MSVSELFITHSWSAVQLQHYPGLFPNHPAGFC